MAAGEDGNGGSCSIAESNLGIRGRLSKSGSGGMDFEAASKATTSPGDFESVVVGEAEDEFPGDCAEMTEL